ncbi:MAG: hypothetical protein ACR2QM_14735 [Longimicrobiales bacterium]
MTAGASGFPDGKRFAFSIVDDTDVSTVENVKPVYDLLYELGLKTTKTVWPLSCPEGSENYESSETLEDPEYEAFVHELAARGFEITWHGPTMESSRRERIVAGLAAFRKSMGYYPRIHINHGYNQDNVFWGHDRIDQPLLKRALRATSQGRRYLGHEEGSENWWGDLFGERFDYVRNLTFDEINLLKVNPTMPYRDPNRDLGPLWFSSSDANDVFDFNELLREGNQRRLEEEGGICIVATHFGKGFSEGGRVNARTEELLRQLAARPGWFVPVGTLLDRRRLEVPDLPRREWRRMQWRWARDLVARRLPSYRKSS